MRKEEAIRIRELIAQIEMDGGAQCINIGSSTLEFRTRVQPHIDEELIRPLQGMGYHVRHCDLKRAEGVDLVGDILSPALQRQISATPVDVALCCNLLEHLMDPISFARACGAIVRPGGYLVVSMPYSYPLHHDPIDTMLRLAPDEIHGMFEGWELVHSEIITSQTYLEELRETKGAIWVLLKHIAQVMLPFHRPSKWGPKAHKLLWLFRPYKVSVALLRKPADPPSGERASGFA